MPLKLDIIIIQKASDSIIFGTNRIWSKPTWVKTQESALGYMIKITSSIYQEFSSPR